MDDTTRYYRQFAAEFFESTVGVDMSPIRERFAALLLAGARVLDAGCGSGRDAKAFAQQGFRVSAFDASPELASRASTHCGFAVDVRSFRDVDEVNAYEGIWCCASLLHIAAEEMPSVLAQLWAALAPGGVLYASFKNGTSTRIHGGRRFTDADESQVKVWLTDLPGADQLDIWLTDDQRPDRTERWTNALVKKAPDSPNRLVTGDRDHFLPHLSEAMSRATGGLQACRFSKYNNYWRFFRELLFNIHRTKC